jgi:hypothetical protein
MFIDPDDTVETVNWSRSKPPVKLDDPNPLKLPTNTEYVKLPWNTALGIFVPDKD